MTNSNEYVPADVVVIGPAQNIICGCGKGVLFDDGPGQERRTLVVDEAD